jgi:uncharacterized membrane protein (DUF2068 family)
MHRTRSLLWAAGLNLLVAVANIVLNLAYLPRGADDLNENSIPYPAVVLGLVIGVLGIVSSYGLWRRERWGLVLTLVLQVLNILMGAPGVLFGPEPWIQVGSVVGILVNAAVIVLLLRRDGRRAAVAA